MFRKMRRFGQQITEEECREILKTSKRGVLSVLGDDGYPYGVPVNFWYDPAEDRIYIHGAKEGHKQDAIRNYDKASFCTLDDGYRKEGEWALNFRSVILFGRIRQMTPEEHEQELAACRELCHKFTDDEEYIEHEIQHAGPRVQVLEFTIEHMTGKKVNES